MKYYTSGELYKDMVKQNLKDEVVRDRLNEMVNQMNAYLLEEHWETKKVLLGRYCGVTMEVAEELFVTTMGLNSTIQEVITAIRGKIAGDYSYIDSIQVATWFVEGMTNQIYRLTRDGEDGQITVESLFRMDDEEKKAYGYMMYPEPELGDLDPNEGGKILGHHKNKHGGKKAMDVIEILQNIEWVIDPYIASMEEEANKTEFDSIKEEMNWVEHKKQSKEARNRLVGRIFRFYSDFCKRGRIYMRGYHVTFNGIKYKAASMDFNESYKVDPNQPI